MDSYFTLLAFDDDLVPEAFQAGQQLVSGGRAIAGILFMPFPFSLEASLALSVPDAEISIRDMSVSVFGDSWMLSAGKRKADWGLGNIFRPLWLLGFISDPYASHLVGLDSPRIWQAGVSIFTGKNTLSLGAYSDEVLVEAWEEPEWWTALLQDEIALGDVSLRFQAAYLYRAKGDAFGGADGSLQGGIEAKYLLNDSLSFSIAQSMLVPPDFSDAILEGTFLVDLISSDKALFFSPEIGYRDGEWLTGASLGYSPSSGIFTASLNAQYDLEQPGFMLYLSADLSVSENLTLSMAGTWMDGRDGSVFADKEAPMSMTLAVRAETSQ